MRLDWDAGLAFGRSASVPYFYSSARDRAQTAYERGGLEPNDLQLHECRHSFSSWLAAAGVPRERRDRYLGHVDNSMDARYTHQLDHQPVPGGRRRAERLPAARRHPRAD
jgi:integrase